MPPRLPEDWKSRSGALAHPTANLVACPVGRGRLDGGVGVWRGNGESVVWLPRAHRLAWLGESEAAVVVYQRGHRDEPPLSPTQVVARVAAPAWRIDAELSLAVGAGGCAVEEIAASASGLWAATHRSSGQGEGGFDVIDAGAMERIAGVTAVRGFILEPPVFAPDESRLVVARTPWLGGWWAPPDQDVDEPARGGVARLCTIHEYDLRTRELRQCVLELEVPAGWSPEDPWAETWCGPTEVRPLGRGVRMVLPGGDVFEHPHPLPEILRLPALTAFG